MFFHPIPHRNSLESKWWAFDHVSINRNDFHSTLQVLTWFVSSKSFPFKKCSPGSVASTVVAVSLSSHLTFNIRYHKCCRSCAVNEINYNYTTAWIIWRLYYRGIVSNKLRRHSSLNVYLQYVAYSWLCTKKKMKKLNDCILIQFATSQPYYVIFCQYWYQYGEIRCSIITMPWYNICATFVIMIYL